MIEFTDFDRLAMWRSLQLASAGINSTRENPRVGAVLTKGSEFLAEGFHRAPGFPHAEVEALNALNDVTDAFGATCYVTLEPCSYQGRTGPCAEALIDAGIERVVAAMEDPNPRVSGSGFAILRQAGVKVDVGLCSEEARAMNPGFISRMTRGRPLVWVKNAASLDGKIAMADGESQWITGDSARQDVQRLRARVGAVVTGIETVLVDNPRLTVRHDEAEIDWPDQVPVTQPLRVILDSQGRLPLDAALCLEGGPILWVTTKSGFNLEGRLGDISHWEAPADAKGRVDLTVLLLHLASLGINEILVEAGATLSSSFIEIGLVDKGVLYLAPKFLGQPARSLYNLAPAHLADAPTVFISEVRKVGDDLRLDWILRTE